MSIARWAAWAEFWAAKIRVARGLIPVVLAAAAAFGQTPVRVINLTVPLGSASGERVLQLGDHSITVIYTPVRLEFDRKKSRPFLTVIVAAQLQPDERRLSVREQHIFAEVCRGKGNKEIASILQITEPSVKAGLQRLFQRFGATNRAQLVAAASGVGAGERG